MRRRDYYAVKEAGVSMEPQITRVEEWFLPVVARIRTVGSRLLHDPDAGHAQGIAEDVRACGVFLIHLCCRSPQWLGDDFVLGMATVRRRFEEFGADFGTAVMELWQQCECVLVVSETPAFVIGDCGPFLTSDAVLGVDNETKVSRYPGWQPASERLWMALSTEIALGVARTSERPRGFLNVLPATAQASDWARHFNEICAQQSVMLAGASEACVRRAAQTAWNAAGWLDKRILIQTEPAG